MARTWLLALSCLTSVTSAARVGVRIKKHEVAGPRTSSLPYCGKYSYAGSCAASHDKDSACVNPEGGHIITCLTPEASCPSGQIPCTLDAWGMGGDESSKVEPSKVVELSKVAEAPQLKSDPGPTVDASEFPYGDGEIEKPTTILRDLSVKQGGEGGGLDKFKHFLHVAAYVIVEPADGNSKPKIILQNPVPAPHPPLWQTMGGYRAEQSLAYKIHAIRSEMYDEGNVVVTKENLIRASPVYITKAGALLQVFYLREGEWLSEIGSWEYGRRPTETMPGICKPILHAIDLYNPDNEEQLVDEYLAGFRGADLASFVWLKNGGVIDGIQDEEGTADLWKKGVLQTFDEEVAQEDWFNKVTNRLKDATMKRDFKKVLTSPWRPVSKKESFYIP